MARQDTFDGLVLKIALEIAHYHQNHKREMTTEERTLSANTIHEFSRYAAQKDLHYTQMLYDLERLVRP